MIKIKKTFFARLALIAASSVGVGCRLPQRPQIITISKPPIFRPSKPADIKSFEQAMAAIMTVCTEDLGFPPVDPVQLLLYKDTASFASYGHGWATLPIDLAHVTADTQDNKIRIDLEKVQGQPWWRITDLLVHEYGHVLQYALGGKESEQKITHWFREGFADWIAAKVFESLKWKDPAITLHRAKLELIYNRDLFAGLHALDYQWTALLNKPKGDIRTYTVAFVAVDKLIETKGLLPVLEYIRSGDFNTAFHTSLDAFETEFDNYFSNLMPPINENGIALQKPDWKIGFQWTYTVKGLGKTATETKGVVEDTAFEGVPAYSMKIGKLETFYAKKNLERLGSKQDGKVVNKRNDPSHDLSWPLTLGKHWENRYTWEDFVHRTKYSTDLIMVMSGIEKTNVAAGTFVAARIEAHDLKTGHLMAEYWYAPATKWYIKIRMYNTTVPVLEEELTSFKID